MSDLTIPIDFHFGPTAAGSASIACVGFIKVEDVKR
jgi:hypothetical protein